METQGEAGAGRQTVELWADFAEVGDADFGEIRLQLRVPAAFVETQLEVGSGFEM